MCDTKKSSLEQTHVQNVLVFILLAAVRFCKANNLQFMDEKHLKNNMYSYTLSHRHTNTHLFKYIWTSETILRAKCTTSEAFACIIFEQKQRKLNKFPPEHKCGFTNAIHGLKIKLPASKLGSECQNMWVYSIWLMESMTAMLSIYSVIIEQGLCPLVLGSKFNK